MTAAEIAGTLADESFRHSWDMSDERRIDGAWVAGLCCECGAFVPYGQEVAHVAGALTPLLADHVRRARAEALREAADEMNVEGVRFKSGGWGSNPSDQQTIDALVKAIHWLRDRADRIETEETQ